MRILLLGKNGQLGWELQRTLLSLGEVITMDYPELDMADGESLRNFVQSIGPQVIVNTAAYTNVDKAETEPELAFAVNTAAPGILAEEAEALDAVLVHYSTDYVFDGEKGFAYAEEDLPNPINTYGKSKLMGEQAVQCVNVPFFIFRTSWVYSMRSRNFITNVVDWARQQPFLRIVTDQIANPTWCRMLAQMTGHVLSMVHQNGRDWMREKRGLYHLAGNGYASRFDVARKILENIPKEYPILAEDILPAFTSEFNDLAKRPLFSALDTSKFIRSFGLDVPSWEKSLQLALSEYFITN